MGLLELVHDMEIRAETPDGIAAGTVVGYARELSLSFVPGYYAHADLRNACAKLEALAPLLWKEWQSSYYRMFARANRSEAESRSPALTVADQEHRARLAAHVVTCASADGLVTVSATGLFNWSMQVRDPSPTEQALTSAAADAAQRAVRRHLIEVTRFGRRLVDR